MTSSGGRSTEEASYKDLERVIINTDPKKFFQVGLQLPLHEKQALIEFLRDNIDVFAWDACEAPGIDPDFICHHLNDNPSIIPKKQQPRRSSKDHYEAVKEEITKLKRVGAIKGVFYPEWLANTVVVKKKNGKWRLCVDFTDLNKTCPKDPFPLPRIDQLVDVTVDHPRMSFLDTFQGYHQIPLPMTIRICHPYWELPLQGDAFRFEKRWSMYQRMMTKMFEA